MLPPISSGVPDEPELPRLTVAGASTARFSVLVLSFWFVSVTSLAFTVTTWLFVPVIVYSAFLVAPEQVTLVLGQLKLPPLVMPTTAPVHVPAPDRTMVPRSRSRTQVRVSGFTTRAVAVACLSGLTGVPVAAAAAGVAVTA